MRDLVLHLKSCYFQEIKEGRKRFEYRLVKPYWQKRIVGQTYDRVIFWDAYKTGGPDTVIVSPWRGYEVQTISNTLTLDLIRLRYLPFRPSSERESGIFST